MGGKRDYRRWDYDDETEITMEEQDNRSSLAGSAETLTSNATFSPPNVLLTSSPIRRERGEGCGNRSRKTSIKEKAQILVLSAAVLLVGFIVGFGIGVTERGSRTSSSHSKHFPLDQTSSSSHERNDLIFHEQISAQNIRDNLKTMTKEEHRAGTKEGHEMAIAIRDLWRSYGISVRVEQHKALLTKTEAFNYLEILSENGTVVDTTSKVGDSVNSSSSSRPIVAFSPPADLNGTLVYGHYGRPQDFQKVQKSLKNLNGSIALVRYGSLHPSSVAANAAFFGIKGLLFYPDPYDFGPQLPLNAVRSSSLLTVGQVHEYQKRKGNWKGLTALTVSAADAEKLLRTLETTEKVPKEWEAELGLNLTYHLGGMNHNLVRIKVFNEAKTTNIFNVIAAIPGTIDYDRYVILGCSHDSWAGAGGASDPGIGLAMTTELLRVLATAWNAGWRPRRSILVISWDANLFASSGTSHWLQEHHFEIGNRAIAYIDMTRALKGNQSLEVFSSPLLKEVTRKAINKIKHFQVPKGKDFVNVQWNSVVSSDEPAFTFIGNLGIPFIRLSVSNAPKSFDYPLFHTGFDTFDNFLNLVDSDLRVSEALGRIIAEIIVLLADSSALPMTLHDYVKDIRKEFDHFMAEYHDDFQKANLSYAQLQSAVRRLEITAENFKTQGKNHSKNNEDSGEFHHRKLRREMEHRILNDKLMSVEKALLTRNAEANDGYKHQIIGHKGTDFGPTESKMARSGEESHSTTTRKPNSHPRKVFSPHRFPSSQTPHFFPKLRLVLECGRSCERKEPCVEFGNGESCMGWKSMAVQRISSLVKSLDAVSAIIQSPLVAQTHE